MKYYVTPALSVEEIDAQDVVRTSLLGDGDYGAEWDEKWNQPGGINQ